MTTIASKLSLPITTMIRMDHTHALSTFHQYALYKAPKTKQALVNTLCMALEIHAQLEEEIFYPAMRNVEQGEPVLEKSKPEHDEMRRLIARLRASSPTDADYDDTVMELMRDVIHHVADEETTLLPQAERLLGKDRLCELGAQMTKRRVQLVGPNTWQIAKNTTRGYSESPMFRIGLLFAAGCVINRLAIR
jgi:hemerythrin superfamily protein